MHEVRTETPRPKGQGARQGEFSRNAKMKRLNPYWAQEQTLRRAQGKA